jgi:Zn ribbon nucleic-acid-binding protein
MRTRKRTIWVAKEDGFICGTCKAKGGCSDEKDSTEPFFWDDDAKKITCVKCGHQLTTKEELEDPLIIDEIQMYGFWLRFLSEHFIPCKTCQEKLDKVFSLSRLTKNIRVNSLKLQSPHCITLHISKNERDLEEFMFMLGFASENPLLTLEFVPCDKCQGKLLKTFNSKEIHIGNDSKPLVELWRKWEHIDEYKNL